MTGDYLPTRTTYEFQPQTARRRINQARLNAIIAAKNPAIEAPRGVFNLEDVGIVPAKTKPAWRREVPKEIEPMTTLEATFTSTNGTGAATAVAATPAKRNNKPLSDERIRDIYAEYEAGATIRELAAAHRVSNTTLTKQFDRLGLPVRPKGFRLGTKLAGATRKAARQTYTPPTVTAVHLNGTGPHAEAAREMVAEHVGAQTPPQTAVALTQQGPAQTAVPLPGNILAFLADMERIGGQVFITGEMNLNIRVTF